MEVINNFAGAEPAVATSFFQAYFISVMQDIFFVLTDTDHKSGFKLQSLLLARLFTLVETNIVAGPLDASQAPSEGNPIFLRRYTAGVLKSAFPNVHP